MTALGATLLSVVAAAPSPLDAGAQLEALRGHGLRSYRVLGVDLRLPGDALTELSRSLPAGAQLQRVPLLRPQLEMSLPAAGFPISDPDDTDGAGALVGILDTGIDLQSEAFRRPDGSHRVLAYWNQDLDQRCDGPAIAAGTCSDGDMLGHGTSVAAIVAAAAPGADLIVVGSSELDRALEGIAWIFEQADVLDRPLVLNLSLGDHAGPHDGTGVLEDDLVARLGPGRLIVAAAGNDARRVVHAALPENGPLTAQLRLFPGELDPGVLIEAWLPPGSARTLRIDHDTHGSTPSIEPASEMPLEAALGTARVSLASSRDNRGRTQLLARIELGDEDGTGFSAHFEGAGTGDAWIHGGSLFEAPPTFATGGDETLRLASPGVAPGVISVASFVARDSWQDDSGQTRRATAAAGERSTFSAAGPSANPANTGPKPEISAPGEVVLAPRHPDAIELAAGTFVDGETLAFRGTSAAAPHVSAALARLLALEPTLTPQQAREILAQSARRDAFTGEAPDPESWGAGKLDAGAALTLLGPERDGGGGCQATHAPAETTVLIFGLFACWRRSRRRENRHRGAPC